MNTKHTPGPWVVSLSPNLVGAIDDGGERETVAETVGPNKEANAHLIAAAPDLLEACKMMLLWLETPKTAELNSASWRECLPKGRAAIAKALGSQPSTPPPSTSQ